MKSKFKKKKKKRSPEVRRGLEMSEKTTDDEMENLKKKKKPGV